MRARLISLEGGEGCGKSTQARWLAERLGAVLTHEPGATPLGAEIRRLLLDRVDLAIDARAETLLLAADRAQHVAEVVRPALQAGRHVVTDRFAGSSLAYQGFGRGLGVQEVERISRWAAAGVWPDLVVLIELPPSLAAARAGRARDRFEAAGAGFHRRVAEGFSALAAAEPDRWAVVDGRGDEEAVAAAVWAAVAARLPDLAPSAGAPAPPAARASERRSPRAR